MLNKQLINFIDKYTISTVDRVIYNINDNKLKVNAVSDSSDLQVIVTVDVNLPNGSYGILDSKFLKNSIKMMDASLKIDYIKSGDRIISLRLKDKKREANIVAAHPDIIKRPKNNDIIQFDESEITFKLTKEFIKEFNDISGILKVDRFLIPIKTVESSLKFIFSSNNIENSDKFILTLDDENILKDQCLNKIYDEMSFDITSFKQILSANKDIIDSGIIRLNTDIGIMTLEFSDDEIHCKYQMAGIIS
jgi:hypothetical protein